MSRDSDIKRHRDLVDRLGIPEKIPPEKRGMLPCPACKGKGHFLEPWVGPPQRGQKNPDVVWIGCKNCDARGEVRPDGKV